jgi:hypothetical protein
MNVLLMIASPFAGYVRDVRGTYTVAFLILAALNLLGAVLFLLAKRPSPIPAPRRPESTPKSVT